MAAEPGALARRPHKGARAKPEGARRTEIPGRPVDYGYFGPESVVWQVFATREVMLVVVAATALFEVRHRGLLSVILGFDPLLDTAARERRAKILHAPPPAQRSLAELTDRYARTVVVPIPIIAGDTATADRVSRQLRNYHKPMKVGAPGTAGGAGDWYEAGGPELMLFAHVTIFHAALRCYEGLVSRDHRPPHRLQAGKRDQYWSELVAFGKLMGIPQERIPDSTAAVAAYYRGIRDEYQRWPAMGAIRAVIDNWRLAAAATKPEELPNLVRGIILATLAVPASVSVLPKPLRRLLFIPRIVDPLIALARAPIVAAMTPLRFPQISDRLIAYLYGDELNEVVKTFRRTFDATLSSTGIHNSPSATTC